MWEMLNRFRAKVCSYVLSYSYTRVDMETAMIKNTDVTK